MALLFTPFILLPLLLSAFNNALGADAPKQWSKVVPLTDGKPLWSATYFDDSYLVGGSDGQLIASIDGRTWVMREIDTTNHITSATASPVLLLLEAGNSIHISTNGYSFTSVPAPTTDDGILGYHEGAYFRLGVAGSISVSTNGNQWSVLRNEDGNEHFRSLTFGEGKVVAFSDRAIFISDDGLQWTRGYETAVGAVPDVGAYGNGTFLAVDENASIHTSTDGTNWVMTELKCPIIPHSLFFHSGSFIGTDGVRFFSSEDGAVWENITPLETVQSTSVLRAGGRFILIGNAGSLASGEEIDSLEVISLGISSSLKSVAAGPESFVAVSGTFGRFIGTSSDGLSWARNPYFTERTTAFVNYSKGRFIAGGALGRIYVSTNGAAWSMQVLNMGGTLRSFATDGETEVIAGDSQMLYSTNLTNWARGTINTARGAYNDVAYGDGRWVAVGENFAITSTNGRQWTDKFLTNNPNLQSIAFGNGLFVAGGFMGRVLTSSDGVNWTNNPSITTNIITDIIYFDGAFFATIGLFRTQNNPPEGIIVSTNGVDWATSSINLPPGVSLFGITASSDSLIAVGDYGAELGYIYRYGILSPPTIDILRRSDYLEISLHSAVGTQAILEQSNDLETWNYLLTAIHIRDASRIALPPTLSSTNAFIRAQLQ